MHKNDKMINMTLNSMNFTEDSNFYFGLILAITSSFFIGSSFIIKKKALIRLNKKGCLRAGSGGFGYLKDWLWWTGLISMGIGEISNFAAYTFAPASLVTPLGALSVLVSAVLSSICLKEHLNILGKIGCILCILGSIIIVVHSPSADVEENSTVLLEKLQQFSFVMYTASVVILVLLIIFYLGPKYGNNNVIYFILLCSTIGSLTVVSCKGLGITIRDNLIQNNSFVINRLTCFLAISIIICITVQMIYLNRALDLFSANIVIPIYFVFFTTFTLIASNILFKEWQRLHFVDIISSICGFFIVVIAVMLLNTFKTIHSNNDINNVFRAKKDLLKKDVLENFYY